MSAPSRRAHERSTPTKIIIKEIPETTQEYLLNLLQILYINFASVAFQNCYYRLKESSFKDIPYYVTKQTGAFIAFYAFFPLKALCKFNPENSSTLFILFMNPSNKLFTVYTSDCFSPLNNAIWSVFFPQTFQQQETQFPEKTTLKGVKVDFAKNIQSNAPISRIVWTHFKRKDAFSSFFFNFFCTPLSKGKCSLLENNGAIIDPLLFDRWMSFVCFG